MNWVSKWIFHKTNVYLARKSIHILATGFPVLIFPLFETLFPILLIYSLFSVMGLYSHVVGKEKKWYQIKNNYGDVYYCFTFVILFAIFGKINLGIAITSALFIAFGDAVTGIIRSFVNKKRGSR